MNKVIGPNNEPLDLHWAYKRREIDNNLLLFSLYSGAYGDQYYNYVGAITHLKYFLKYVKSFKTYQKQFEYILANCNKEVVVIINKVINKKFNVEITHEDINKVDGEA